MPSKYPANINKVFSVLYCRFDLMPSVTIIAISEVSSKHVGVSTATCSCDGLPEALGSECARNRLCSISNRSLTAQAVKHRVLAVLTDQPVAIGVACSGRHSLLLGEYSGAAVQEAGRRATTRTAVAPAKPRVSKRCCVRIQLQAFFCILSLIYLF